MKLLSVFIIITIFLIGLVSAPSVGDGTSDFTEGRVIYTEPEAPINYSIQNVSTADFWDLLDTPADIDHNLLNNLEWSLAGHTIDTNFMPDTTLSYDIGSGALRWLTIYSQDINTEHIDTFTLNATGGNITTDQYFIGSGVFLDGLNISGGDLTGYALNISFLYGHDLIGAMDLRGDPWYFQGADFQIAENLLVDGNITAVENISGAWLVGNHSWKSNDSYIRFNGTTASFNETKLGDYAKYEFENNNFNGSGNFTTSGNVTASFIGNLLNRIKGLFVLNININETIEGDFNISTNGSYLNMYNHTIIVAKRGGDFTTIQGAIDSVPDIASCGTGSDYGILIYSGVYNENIVGTNCTELRGMGEVIINGSVDYLYTPPSRGGSLYNLKFTFYPIVVAQEIMFTDDNFKSLDETFYIKDCEFYIESSANDITIRALYFNSGDFWIEGNKFEYNYTGTSSANKRTQTFIFSPSSEVDFTILNNKFIMNSADEDDSYYVLYDSSTNKEGFLIEGNDIYMNLSNGNYAGESYLFYFDGNSAQHSIIGNKIIAWSGSGGSTGNMTVYFSDSNDDGMKIQSSANTISITNFDKNWYAWVVNGADKVYGSESYLDASDGIKAGSAPRFYVDDFGVWRLYSDLSIADDLAVGDDITSLSIGTAGNELFAHDRVWATIDADDIANGYACVGWEKAGVPLVNILCGASIDDGTQFYGGYETDFEGSSICCYCSTRDVGGCADWNGEDDDDEIVVDIWYEN